MYITTVISTFSAVNIPVLNLLNPRTFKHITKDSATLHEFLMFPDLKDSYECTFLPIFGHKCYQVHNNMTSVINQATGSFCLCQNVL